MKTKIFIAVFAVFAALVSCKKAEKGDMGPAGANGTNGINGNANVKAFYFGKDSIETGHSNFSFALPSSVTSNMLDSSAVLMYHQANGFWYASPGLGWGALYQTRVYTNNLSRDLYFGVLNPDGTSYSGSKIIITKFKVVIIPSSDFSGFRKKPVDFADYEATMKYYGLSLD